MKILFVFAHPDDESFSSGGTISHLAGKGHQVVLICVTRGEKGLNRTPPVCQPSELGETREKELRKAAKILGISRIYFLDYVDGTLNKISIKHFSQKIFQIIKKEKPDVVVTFNKDGGSRHPDHVKTSKVATLAFKKYLQSINKHVRLYYTVMPRSIVRKLEEKGLIYSAFGKVKGTRDSQITTIVDISETIEDKIKAVKCHQTQNKDVERFLKRREHLDKDLECFRLVLENEIA